MTRAQWFGLSAGVVTAGLLPSPAWSLIACAVLALAGAYSRLHRPAAESASSVSCTRLLPVRRVWWLPSSVWPYVVAGMATASVQFLDHQQSAVREIETRRVSGCIVTPVAHRNGVYRFVLESVTRTVTGRSMRYRIAWYTPEQVPGEGSCWRLTLRLKPPRGSRNEVGFDYERWLFARRLHAHGSVRGSVPAVELPWSSANAGYALGRQRLYARLLELSGDRPGAPLVGALAVGRRDGLDREYWDVLKRTGTAHLMAISGLHVGLAALVGAAFGRYAPLLLRPNVNLINRGVLTSLLTATLYAAAAGFAVSTVRALFMLTLWHLCRAAQRSVDVTTTLLMTVAVLLMCFPWWVADSGFWLSVSAVSAITLAVFGRPAATTWTDRCRLALRIQLGITLLMLPLSAHVAGGISWISVPVNLVLIPLFSVCVVPLVLLLLFVVIAVPVAAPAVATGLTRTLDVIWNVLEWLALQPWAYSPVASTSSWLTAPATICGLLLLLPRALPGRWTGLLLLLPLFWARAQRPAEGDVQLDVLDLGQALAVVIQTRTSTVVYDTGNAWPGGDSAEQVLLPVLSKRRVSRLSALIVSHADRDHAGGAARVHRALPIGVTWVGEPMESLPGALPCERGVQWRVDGVSFKFLHPRDQEAHTGNEQSCVLFITGYNVSVLLTGDLGRVRERGLIPDLEGQVIDVVIGAHHGSLSSSDPRFIEAVQPAFVVFSNGFGNQWGMPRAEVVDRWERVGTRVLTTADAGQLTFGPDDGGRLTLQTRWRDRGFGVWRQRSTTR